MHSRENTSRGKSLKDICDQYGLVQLVHEPTRGDYLLDLCLSSTGNSKVEVHSKIADHACVVIKEPDAIEIRKKISKSCGEFVDHPSG